MKRTIILSFAFSLFLISMLSVTARAYEFLDQDSDISKICNKENYREYVWGSFSKTIFKKDKGCYLKGVDFQGSNFWEANFSGATLSSANLSDTDLYKSNFSHANLIKVKFNESDLYEVVFKGANLKGAYFQNASLYRADLKESNLEGVDFSFSELDDCDVRGVDLRKTINLNKARSLSEIKCDNETKFPKEEPLSFKERYGIHCEDSL